MTRLEKEIAAFVASLDFHLVHLIEAAMPHLRGESKSNSNEIIKRSMLDLWNQRNSFDPMVMRLPQFFGALVKRNVREMVRFEGCVLLWDSDGEERLVFDAITGGPKRYVARIDKPQWAPTAEHAPVAKLEPTQKVGKQCPPCWRCKWFYGWLPTQEFVPETHADKEVEEACLRIDRRKIAIATMVRGSDVWTEAELMQE